MEGVDEKRKCPPCGYSINWYCSLGGKQAEPEVTLGALGRKQGAKDLPNRESRLSRLKLFEAYKKIEGCSESENYDDLKSAAVISGDWAAKRDRFFESDGFKGWKR
eukprot:CAMPEP_0171476078 /NCGR_PEP_ID=MMETSP0946-20130122/3381_1 /TAXON_ID=109269 /ORGANISM="Vaucheria litorea, Strain CCMP2940" /LENGTH=105 /DNA_ID=CAMNT_0012006281 /DNA_START=526 /DNA_END=843 /DNA_ORIENTATION=-